MPARSVMWLVDIHNDSPVSCVKGESRLAELKEEYTVAPGFSPYPFLCARLSMGCPKYWISSCPHARTTRHLCSIRGSCRIYIYIIQSPINYKLRFISATSCVFLPGGQPQHFWRGLTWTDVDWGFTYLPRSGPSARIYRWTKHPKLAPEIAQCKGLWRRWFENTTDKLIMKRTKRKCLTDYFKLKKFFCPLDCKDCWKLI